MSIPGHDVPLLGEVSRAHFPDLLHHLERVHGPRAALLGKLYFAEVTASDNSFDLNIKLEKSSEDTEPELYLEVPDIDPELVVVVDDGLELCQEAGNHLVLALDLVMAALFVQHQEGVYQPLERESTLGRLQDLETDKSESIQTFS